MQPSLTPQAPGQGCRVIVFWLPAGGMCRRSRRSRVHGKMIPYWVPFTLLLRDAERQWTLQDPTTIPVRNAILKRDGYHCAFLGCSRRSMLEANHNRPRSLGGGNEPEKVGILCAIHHRHVFHKGYAKIKGVAPHGLRFEIGRRPDGRPIVVTEGHLIIERTEPATTKRAPSPTPKKPEPRPAEEDLLLPT